MTWTLGVLVGLPVVLLVLITLPIVVIIWALRNKKPEGDYYADGLKSDEVTFCVVISGVLLFLGVAILSLGYFPYGAQYHQYNKVHGYVDSVNNKLVGSDDYVSVDSSIEIAGVNYRCDDVRCTNVRHGDLVSLSCRRTWTYAGLDGYNCKFEGVEH